MKAPALLAFDVDGVLTDGSLVYTGAGASQRFDARDGAGIIELGRAGFSVALISFRDLPSTRLRARDLGIDLLMLGCTDKAGALSKLCSFLGIGLKDSLYMGDDRMDLPALLAAGISACPADAAPEVAAVCRIVTLKPGGAGAVREIADLALRGGLS
jgi:3-deoxy-D-manno-octulosonate 8-phosphate phosphatase (KDO 8-P phosphatase)